jgi:hypothetical protein
VSGSEEEEPIDEEEAFEPEPQFDRGHEVVWASEGCCVV